MTFYESNAEVRPTGAEIEEFVDAAPETSAPPRPSSPHPEVSQEAAVRRTRGTRLTHIYLNDHRAGAAAGLALARRCLENNLGSALGRDLEQLVNEIRSDEEALVDVLRHLSVRENRAKQIAARAGEYFGRLKPNGRVRGYSPLSRLLELEMLLAAIDGKRSLWRALAAAEIDVPSTIDLADLTARASSQRDRLRPHHEQAAAEALS